MSVVIVAFWSAVTPMPGLLDTMLSLVGKLHYTPRLSPTECLNTLITTDNGYTLTGPWMTASPSDELGEWKLFLYAFNAADWAHLTQCIFPYLHAYHVFHKTAANTDIIEQLLVPGPQFGKLYTIYSPDVLMLQQIAYDLDKLLHQNKLVLKIPTTLYGAEALGSTGRLSYRHDRDSHGNYQSDDAAYRPASVQDPFVLFPVQKAIADLGPGKTMILGRQNVGGKLWDASIPEAALTITRTATGWQIAVPEANKLPMTLNDEPLSGNAEATPGSLMTMGPHMVIFLDDRRLERVQEIHSL